MYIQTFMSNTSFLLLGYSIKCISTLWRRDSSCWAWWRIGRFDAFRPKGREFESLSSRHVETLGKFFTCSCLWRLGVNLRHIIRAVSGALLTIAVDLKTSYRNGLNEWMTHLIDILQVRHVSFGQRKTTIDYFYLHNSMWNSLKIVYDNEFSGSFECTTVLSCCIEPIRINVNFRLNKVHTILSFVLQASAHWAR